MGVRRSIDALFCSWVSQTNASIIYTAWKVSKYEGFYTPYFPVFSPNTGKYGPKKTPYLDTFHTVLNFY